jgi:pantothenate kinase
MNTSVEQLAETILQRADGRQRFIVAIAGPPGAGKSTLAEALHASILRRGAYAEVLPMDGFHMDNGLLQARGLLARKGAPETFDVRGFIDIIDAVRSADQEVLVPVFDRTRELAIASARAISPSTQIVLVEGNYLLLDEAPWTRLADKFDLTVFVGPSTRVLEDRLHQRWIDHGLDPDAIHTKLHGNDLPNAKRIIEKSRPADINIATFELPVE